MRNAVEALDDEDAETLYKSIEWFSVTETAVKSYLDEYKEKGILNSDSMVITHSIGTKIIPKYLVKNNLNIDTFVSVAGFVDYSGTRTDYIVDVMKITKVSDEEFDKCKELIKNRYSIYSDNDSNSPLEKCVKYADKLDAEKVLVKGAGHFTQEDNVTEIKELNGIIKDYINK